MTKCNGYLCPIKHQCLRFTSPDKEIQCYLTSIPYDDKKQQCSFFIDNRDYQKGNQSNAGRKRKSDANDF